MAGSAGKYILVASGPNAVNAASTPTVAEEVNLSTRFSLDATNLRRYPFGTALA